MSVMMLTIACTNKARAASGSGRRREWWNRDPYHAVRGGKTLCGFTATEWLGLGEKPSDEALSDPKFCHRCAALVLRHETESATS